jgi:hypothetical protein
MSNDFIHSTNKGAQPALNLLYKLALMGFKTYEDKIPTQKWLALNDEQTFTSSQTKCFINSTSMYEFLFNIPISCLTFTINSSYLNWLNLTFATYIVKDKYKETK